MFGAVIANGVGKSGNGGGAPVGDTDFVLYKNSLPLKKLLFEDPTLLHGSFGKFNSSSPRSNVASNDKRETAVMHIVVDVINAVRRPHFSTTIKHNKVLKTLTTPKAIVDVTLAMSKKRRNN